MKLSKDGIKATYGTLAECLNLFPRVMKTSSAKLTVDGLQAKFSEFSAHSGLGKVGAKHRALTWAVSRELSKRGIAPRWQKIPTPDSAHNDTLRMIREMDRPYFDLTWLATNFPGHQCKIELWQQMFEDDLDIDLLERICQRKMNRGDKVRKLALDDLQQYGCNVYASREATARVRDVSEKSDKIRVRQAKRALRSAQLTSERIAQRVIYWQCGRLAKGSPTDTAKLYKMMTGNDISRQAAALQLKNLGIRIRKPYTRKDSLE